MEHDQYSLKHVQELYGKLLHVLAILPQGHAYLTGLEAMLGTFANRPFTLYHPDKCYFW